MRFSLDIDGIVADYGAGIKGVAAKLQIPPQTQPVGLEPDQLDALMSERQQAVRAQVGRWVTDHVEEFYGGLAPLFGESDRRAIHVALSEGHELFWVSNRGFGLGGPGGSVAEGGVFTTLCASATFDWLQRQNLPVSDANLLLTYDKADAINNNDIRHHLDDIVPHVTQIALETKAEVYLLRRPWNQRIIIQGQDEGEYRTTAAAFGVREVSSIGEYLAVIRGRQA